MHVLISGGGIVGLAIAQGCKKRGISYTVFEREKSGLSRSQGWGLTLRKGLEPLAECLPEEVMDKLETASIRPDHPYSDGTIPVLNAATGEVAFSIPIFLGEKPFRVNRKKFRNVLIEGIQVLWEKDLVSFSADENGVTVKFTDGSALSGDILVGADGASSPVRKALLGKAGELNRLPYRMCGVISRCAYSDVQALLDINPWMFLACDPYGPVTGVFALQEIFDLEPGAKEREVEVVSICTWRVSKDEEDVRETDAENLKEMKRRTAHFADPFGSVLRSLPPDSKVQPLKLADWIPVPYDSPCSRVILAGDAAHTMTMYRGEGVNYAFLTAVHLLRNLASVQAGKLSLREAVTAYEKYARETGTEGVLLSRTAIEDAHNFGAVNADSPFIARSA